MTSFLSKYLNHCNEDVTATLHETCDDNDELVCFACMDSVIGGPTYILERGDHHRYCLHKSCAELPGEIPHSLHPQHPLTVHSQALVFICDGCRHVSVGVKYHCLECKFKLDIQCVSKNEGQALKEIVKKHTNEEKHTNHHPHKLQLAYFRSSMPTYLSKSIFCCCCLKSCPDGRHPTYSCNVCLESDHQFFIHKSCFETVPRQVQSSFHPEHPLFIQPLGYTSACEVCREEIIGLAMSCDKCDIKFHVPCGSRTTPGVRLNLHQHNMHYVIIPSSSDSESPSRRSHPEYPLLIQRPRYISVCELCRREIKGHALSCVVCDMTFDIHCSTAATPCLNGNCHPYGWHLRTPSSSEFPSQRSCTICGAKCEGAFYRCVKCRVNVHMECIPLPEIVEHESHDHPLKLTDSVVTHRDDDEYRCDICEEEGNIKHHSYYCDECNYIAHIECVYSEHEDTSSKISCLDPRGKGKAEEEIDDAEKETDDAEEETEDDAGEETEGEVYEQRYLFAPHLHSDINKPL